jgi:copper chaperone
MAETKTRTYTVEGMSCNHCRLSVSEEVSEVAGVEDVEVELADGRLEVVGADVDDAAISAAVEDAGYRLAGSR